MMEPMSCLTYSAGTLAVLGVLHARFLLPGGAAPHLPVAFPALSAEGLCWHPPLGRRCQSCPAGGTAPTAGESHAWLV